MTRPSVRAVAVSTLALAGTVFGQSQVGAPLPGDGPLPPAICATDARDEPNGRVRTLALPNGLADGEPFTFTQDPPLLYADSAGPLTFRNFSVVGDFATVKFLRFTRDAPNGREETWQRATTRSVNGQLISVFQPTWGTSDVDATFQYYHIGFDRPYLYWGAYELPGTDSRRSVYVRAGIHAIPSSTVVKISDRVQYASDVVNLVVPTFDDARVAAGGNGFDIVAATQLFYANFSDAYDVVALTPQSVAVGEFAAFHRNVRNAVGGINLSSFDVSRSYGSSGVLQGVEVYNDAYITRYDTTDHEMTHQWASYFDWTRIADIARAGHQPASHSPLWTGGESLIGAVLFGDRRVAGTAGTYKIEQTPPPASFHPVELYSMGLLPAAQVPDFLVFTDQGQFDASTSVSPSIGADVSGTTQPGSMTDVVRVHGSRTGPSITSPWRRATVLVSTDRLASAEEMSYWNFFAQRLGDRNHASRASFDNYVSFRSATRNAVDIATAAVPLTASRLAQSLEIDTPSFAGTDWRGVTFDSAVPGRFVSGQAVTLTGHVTATDRSDFSAITLGFWGLNATSSINFSGSVSRNGDFTVTIRFSDAQKGTYYLSNYLFWPNSGSQFPRSGTSQFVVE